MKRGKWDGLLRRLRLNPTCESVDTFVRRLSLRESGNIGSGPSGARREERTEALAHSQPLQSSFQQSLIEQIGYEAFEFGLNLLSLPGPTKEARH